LAKPDLGTKRVCPSCTARFYDLQKRPIECPKCAFTFEPEALLKQRRTRVPEPAPKAAPVIVADDEEAEETEDEEVEEEAAEVEEAVEVVEAPIEADPDAENEDGEPVVADTAEAEDDFEDEIEDDDEEDDDTLLEEVEEDEDDVAGIIDADIEKDEP
jgi:uncharacterized protein (TIGR02300 family)